MSVVRRVIQGGRGAGLGAGVVALGIFLVLVAIPQGVTSPSNVRVAVLSPTFWPYIVAGLIIVLGIGLILAAMRRSIDLEPRSSRSAIAPGVRLIAMALLMGLMIWAIPLFGMVWVSIAGFAMLSVLVRTSHPVASAIVAILLPLVLYAFFAHVAGVAIPQGEYLTLP